MLPLCETLIISMELGVYEVIFYLTFLRFCGIIELTKTFISQIREEKLMQFNQISLSDIYSWVGDAFEYEPSSFFKLLREFIDWDEVIPLEFHWAYYSWTGRKREYSLYGMIAMCVLGKVFGFPTDVMLLNVLKHSRELREFCGFREGRVPDASQLSRFKSRFTDHLRLMLDELVELTEPICREMDTVKADMLVCDTTGIEGYVKENNPKFFNSKLRQAKSLAKGNTDADPYKLVYGLLPDCAESNETCKQQYINGHFCYAQKYSILTNGLGFVRGIQYLGTEFKESHPNIKVTKRSDNPDHDKEIGDSTALKPILSDFFSLHPNFRYSTFLGDSAFDSYENYRLLIEDFKFDKVLIPTNERNSNSGKDTNFDENGTPICPITGEPFRYWGKCGGENRSERLKFVCPRSVRKPGSTTLVCECETPCTDSSYGRTIYVYPDADLRLYPGIARGSEEWGGLYKNRTASERLNAYLKVTYASEHRRTSHERTTFSDMLLGGITQLIGLLLAKNIHQLKFARRLRHILNVA